MTRFCVSAAAAALLAASPAAAQDPAPGEEGVPLPGTGLDVAAEINLLSDYRFRGVSRSDEDPALQGALTISHDSGFSGFYVGTRATTLRGLDSFRLRDPSFEDLGEVEADIYAGYGRDLGGGLDLDAGLLYYAFVGGEGRTGYFEPYASLSYLIGPVYATAGAKYAPSQSAIGNENMLYLFGQVDASIPLTPVRLKAQAGRQDWGRFGNYWNWSLGGSYALGPAELGVQYVDTDLPSAPGQDAGLVFSLGLRF